MSESVEILKRLRTSVENGKATDEVKAKATAALSDAIEALEENSRANKPSSESGNEFGLSESVEDTLLRVIEGKPSATEERRQSAVSHLVSLTQNVPSRESESAPVNQLARLVRNYD